jgi:hypothetical protein
MTVNSGAGQNNATVSGLAAGAEDVGFTIVVP